MGWARDSGLREPRPLMHPRAVGATEWFSLVMWYFRKAVRQLKSKVWKYREQSFGEANSQ